MTVTEAGIESARVQMENAMREDTVSRSSSVRMLSPNNNMIKYIRAI